MNIINPGYYDKKTVPEYLYEALDYVVQGKFKIIAGTYSLDDIAGAYENVAAGNVRFRAVIKTV